MLNPKSIGNKIAEARKKINFSQSELAKNVSISPQAVGKWERGESMPDITTLNRLAQILGVDLNYFSDSFQTLEVAGTIDGMQELKNRTSKSDTNPDWNWNMSQGNWVDADFSGLKNLTEKFSSSNMKNCKFIHADLSGLILAKNNIELCDFSFADIRDSKIQSSNLSNNQFHTCSFIDSVFLKNNIGKCDFFEADFSGAEILDGYFESNLVERVVWKHTLFKNMGISNVIFEGSIEDCQFENCAFHNVNFQNATITNTFFKYNRKFKKVQFINCKVDKITHGFLSNNQANLTGITVIE